MDKAQGSRRKAHGSGHRAGSKRDNQPKGMRNATQSYEV